jgi:hypothetical protein
VIRSLNQMAEEREAAAREMENHARESTYLAA